MFGSTVGELTHATLMLPPESTAMYGLPAPRGSFEMFFGVENVAPPSLERVKRICQLPGVLSCQTTLMLPLESTTIWGFSESPGSLERFSGVEKVAPPSLERLKKMS